MNLRLIRRTGMLLTLFLCACAAAPVQEMSNARQAITAAVEAGAQTRAADALARAQVLLESAEAKLHKRNYRGARMDAVSARMEAVAALEQASASGATDP